jgi:leucyl aminopeptidase
MTVWTQIEIAASDEPAAEFALAFAGGDGVRLTSEDARLAGIVARTGFTAAPGRWLDIQPTSDDQPRMILLGAPAGQGETAHDWASLGGTIIEAMAALRIDVVRLAGAAALDADRLGDLLLGALLHSFRYDTGRKTAETAFQPRRLLVSPEAEGARDRALQVAQVVNRARAWVSAPANRLTPPVWAAELPAIFEPLGAVVRLFDRAALEAMGAAALLAVGRASEHGPTLAVVEWRGDPQREGWDAVLVGKGVTFDTGGLNIKTAGMAMMRFDMAGGAAVLGAVELAAARQARCNVVGIVPMVENALDGLGYRPGDVIGSLAGLTVEVRNTDCEGRLLLADGITYGLQTYAPAHIVDIATLTGTIAMVFLGEYAAVYSNDDAIADGLDAAGKATGELVWRMPCQPNQDYVVESTVADVANQSTFPGAMGLGIGAPMSGPKMLQKFVGDTPWAHIDIAGTVWSSRRSAYGQKDATGYGVRLLDRWLSGLETGSAASGSTIDG